MNKALEQKLIGPMEESNTKEQCPKQFCEKCFEQGDQKWQQNELGLGFELDIGVCGRKKKCVGAGISGGEPPWAHEAGGARPPPSWQGGWPPWCVLCSINPQIFYKNHI